MEILIFIASYLHLCDAGGKFTLQAWKMLIEWFYCRNLSCWNIGKHMKKKKINHKKYKFTYIKVTMSTLFLGILFLKGYTPFEHTGENIFHIQVNGQDVGTLGDKSHVEELLLQARRNVVSVSDDLVFMDVDMAVVGEEVLWGEVDREEDVLRRMEAALQSGVYETMQRSYTLKINEYIINLASMEDVRGLLQAAIDKYGGEGKFIVELKQDAGKEFNIFTPNIARSSSDEEERQSHMEAGVEKFLAGITGTEAESGEKDFGDYDLGIQEMHFSEDVEITEAYLPPNRVTSLEDAIHLVLMEQEMPAVYEVAAGDTLTEIAIKLNIPMDKIAEMNGMKDINDILNIGDQLLITVPEPELSVERVEEKYYEESYETDVIYIDNPDWYTNHSVLRRQPSAGARRIIANVSYINDREVGREILKEEVLMEAVAKVIERGTVVPPTYIKPISGGRLTSGFGMRDISVPGATSNHKAVDWAVPTGTTVFASSGGTVSRAGWGSGYGYVVYIDHPDGRQTRYAHLSKVLVSVGQKVNQGEKIALSGSTGVASGPHLHFELLISGTQVNPMDYVK